MPEEEKLNHKAPSEKQREQKIAPRRLETIFRTNMRVSYASGRYKHMLEMADERPWWRYRTVRDNRVRADHAALDGLIFHYTDPFWQTHYPPNGWNCRCEVESLDDIDMELDGLTPSDSSKFRVETNGVVGYDINGDTVIPETGWRYNPAQDGPGQMLELARRKAETYPPGLKEQFTADLDEAERANQERLKKLEAKNTTREEEKEEQPAKVLETGLISNYSWNQNKQVAHKYSISADGMSDSSSIRINNIPSFIEKFKKFIFHIPNITKQSRTNIDPSIEVIVKNLLEHCDIEDNNLRTALLNDLPIAISSCSVIIQHLWEISAVLPYKHHFFINNGWNSPVPFTRGREICANLSTKFFEKYMKQDEVDLHYFDLTTLGHEMCHFWINCCCPSYFGAQERKDNNGQIILTGFVTSESEVGRRLFTVANDDMVSFLNKCLEAYGSKNRLPFGQAINAKIYPELPDAYQKYISDQYKENERKAGITVLADSLAYYTNGMLVPPKTYLFHENTADNLFSKEEGNAELLANVSGVLLRNNLKVVNVLEETLPQTLQECQKVYGDILMEMRRLYNNQENGPEYAESYPCSDSGHVQEEDDFMSVIRRNIAEGRKDLEKWFASEERKLWLASDTYKARVREREEEERYLNEVLIPLDDEYEKMGLGTGIRFSAYGYPQKVRCYPGGVKAVYEEAIRRHMRWEDVVGMTPSDYHLSTRISPSKEP